MKKYHGYSQEEYEMMIPFERSIFVNMILTAIRAEKNTRNH
jgi:hypothetical protein